MGYVPEPILLFYESVSNCWCACLAWLRSLKIVITDSLEPLGSRTETCSGISGSSLTTNIHEYRFSASPKNSKWHSKTSSKTHRTWATTSRTVYYTTSIAVDCTEKANTVALYLSFDGEVSTQQLITCLWQQGIQVAVPVLHPFCPGHLLFLCYHPESVLYKNSFGILEPQLNVQDVVPISALEIILRLLLLSINKGIVLEWAGILWSHVTRLAGKIFYPCRTCTCLSICWPFT